MRADKAITVAELIAILQKFPPSAEVIYTMCSDWSPLQTEDMFLVTAEQKQIIWREANGYSDFNPRWLAQGMVPDFRTVVTLPGN